VDVHGDGSRIAEAEQVLTPEFAQRVRDQARRFGVSAATLFHAAWGLVLSRTSAREDVVFGTVLLGRLQEGTQTQRTLGMFVNTLPLHLRLHGLTAKELVEHAQRELMELLTHEQASLVTAQRCSSVTGSAPLFTTLLNYRHSSPSAQSDWSSADGFRVLRTQERTNYPIVMSVDDMGPVFVLSAQNDQRIDPQRIIDYLHTTTLFLVEALESAPGSVLA
jgi:non-ribosomal peptide synthetase component F